MNGSTLGGIFEISKPNRLDKEQRWQKLAYTGRNETLDNLIIAIHCSEEISV